MSEYLNNYVRVIARARRPSRTTAEPLIIMILSIAIVSRVFFFLFSLQSVSRACSSLECDDTSSTPIRIKS